MLNYSSVNFYVLWPNELKFTLMHSKGGQYFHSELYSALYRKNSIEVLSFKTLIIFLYDTL